MPFDSFDPLLAKQAQDSVAALHSIRREIENILDSYFDWFDPFSEIIQNALDAVDARRKEESKYTPKIEILIDVKNNLLSVCDNGVGLDESKFRKFLAPSFSFKGKSTRGHKGVGATYLAYGFNYIQVATKHPDFSGIGAMKNARKWINRPLNIEEENPKIEPDNTTPSNELFELVSRGTCVTVHFDKHSKPSKLSWLKASSAEQWEKILRVKTGLGAINYSKTVNCKIVVKSQTGQKSEIEIDKPRYLWPHLQSPKAKKLSEIAEKEKELFEKKGVGFTMPSTFNHLECIYGRMEPADIIKNFELSSEDKILINKYKAKVYFSYFYTAKFWRSFNDNLGIRGGQQILKPGIQLAANNMPQGEMSTIDLKRNIGRQNQMHVVCHFSNAKSDLGRKGFQEELVELVNAIAKELIEKKISKYKKYMKVTTGVAPSLLQKQKVDDWKKEFEKHETSNPLIINNPLFFQPKKTVSVTSEPTREQDVIALFNQFLSGGVIRGIDILSTNERFIYDSMFRVTMENDEDVFIHDKETNPLGVRAESVEIGFRSSPKILEYKFSLDALIEDINNGSKNTNEIDLVVVWETGNDYEGFYRLTSLLDHENLSERAYHGLTHVATNLESGQQEFNLIVLSELVNLLNDPEEAIKLQRKKYED